MDTLTGAAPALTDVAAAVRASLRTSTDWTDAARLVADGLRGRLPGPEILTPAQRLGDPGKVAGHLLYSEPDGSFSITAVVWRPGQATRIHDHITWCVVGVLQGVEHEELYDADLNRAGVSDNLPGEVTGFAPPGDIHRIMNTGAETAISLHVYGTDLSRVGSSARRYYEEQR
ncbi:Cysteine dioxygenase type I [Glycomyces sambucus]|uniref:Cysteine dioxygenase type I n=1 Tax=Glycomyces sambucus TaxID=380244 RepID=A0A1G9GUV1_9ACTN|nr:cysteine dioxygenase family protein [Glycomyces sambucus]SDL04451.1 Cysteine dioxygenase type I [Glycomyces sambucus]